jgi:Tol biopolymer transport system component
MEDANTYFKTPKEPGRRTKILLGLLFCGLFLVSIGCEEDLFYPVQPRTYPIIGEYQSAVWGPKGQIAVIRMPLVDGDYEPFLFGLYTLREDGTDPLPVVFGQIRDYDWSPDGEWIAFTGGQGLNVVKPDGSKLQLIRTDQLAPIGVSWSPDSKWILFSVISGIGDNRGLWVIRPDGTGMRQLRKPPTEQMCINCGTIDRWEVNVPDWSSDGSKITYSATVYNSVPGGSYIAVYDTTSAQVDFIFKSSILLFHPRFSPDGNRITFSTNTVGDGQMRIGFIDIDRKVVRWLPISGEKPSWSPDGRKILYRRYDFSVMTNDLSRLTENPGKGWGDLWVIDDDANNHRQLTFTNGVWGGP